MSSSQSDTAEYSKMVRYFSFLSRDSLFENAFTLILLSFTGGKMQELSFPSKARKRPEPRNDRARLGLLAWLPHS